MILLDDLNNDYIPRKPRASGDDRSEKRERMVVEE